MTSGQLLREARKRAGLTQEELGRRAGLQQSVIGRWERDHVKPSFERLGELIDACGLSLVGELYAADDSYVTQALGLRDLSPTSRLMKLTRHAGSGAGPFRPLAVLEALVDAGAEFVLIGSAAAAIHGSPWMSNEPIVAIVPNAQTSDRLDGVLDSLGGVRDAPVDRYFGLHAIEPWELPTQGTILQRVTRPAGSSGYTDLRRDATAVELEGAVVDVVSLPDLIRISRASPCPQDRIHLPALTAALAVADEARR